MKQWKINLIVGGIVSVIIAVIITVLIVGLNSQLTSTSLTYTTEEIAQGVFNRAQSDYIRITNFTVSEKGEGYLYSETGNIYIFMHDIRKTSAARVGDTMDIEGSVYRIEINDQYVYILPDAKITLVQYDD